MWSIGLSNGRHSGYPSRFMKFDGQPQSGGFIRLAAQVKQVAESVQVPHRLAQPLIQKPGIRFV